MTWICICPVLNWPLLNPWRYSLHPFHDEYNSDIKRKILQKSAVLATTTYVILSIYFSGFNYLHLVTNSSKIKHLLRQLLMVAWLFANDNTICLKKNLECFLSSLDEGSTRLHIFILYFGKFFSHASVCCKVTQGGNRSDSDRVALQMAK